MFVARPRQMQVCSIRIMTAPSDGSKASSAKHGPHNGPLLAIESGFVELSVFETGVPPIFRLYFSDREGIPRAPPTAESVNLVTTRPDGEEQTFAFRAVDNFLESTTDIPEPHEFVAIVAVAHDGHEHRYETQFTEADHGQAHGGHARGHGGHEHGAHDHDHDHGSGLLGWFRGTFAHSQMMARPSFV